MSSRISGLKCILPHCGKSRRLANVRLFKFPPPDSIIGQIWRQKCNLVDGEINKKRLRLCNCHFVDKYIGRQRLKAEAIPTLFLTPPKESKKNKKAELRKEYDKFVRDGREKKKSCKIRKSIKKAENLLEAITKNLSEKAMAAENDEYVTAANYIAIKLRKLNQVDPKLRTHAENLIYEVLLAGEMGKLDQNTKLYNPSST